jgi:hypothetical protein
LIAHLFPHHITSNQTFNLNTSVSFNKNIIDQKSCVDEEKKCLIDEAKGVDLLPEFQETKPTLKELQSLSGVSKSYAVVIAIKESMSPSRDCMLNSINAYSIHDLIDWLALTKRVTCIRKFGSTWIGCVGLVQTWGTREEDLYNALLLCCEIIKLAKNNLWNITCAIDSGLITGGFIGNKFFDLYGPEVRWILSVVNSNVIREILVSQTVKQFNLKSLTSLKFVFSPVDLDNYFVDTMMHNVIEVDAFSLSNIDDIHYHSSFNADEIMEKYELYTREKELNIKSNIKKESKDNEDRFKKDSQFLSFSDIYYNISNNSKNDDYWSYFWCDNISEEFLTTINERYGVDVDDPVLCVYEIDELRDKVFDFKAKLAYIVYYIYRDKIISFFAAIYYPLSWYENIVHSSKSFINVRISIVFLFILYI